MPLNVEPRLLKLEMVVAEQERTIAELSGEVGKAWKLIEEMNRRIEAMGLRLTGVEEATAPEIPVTKPPHW